MGRSHVCSAIFLFISSFGLYRELTNSVYSCSTCRLNSWSCAGHPGHIELPVQVYNVTYFDQLFRLLRAQCIYCHRFRMPRLQIHSYACRLKLLRYGLVEEAFIVGGMEARKGGRTNADSSDDSSDDEDDDDLMKRRNSYVKRCISNLTTRRKSEDYMKMVKNPAAAEQRRNLVRDFLKEASNAKKCTSCSG